MMQTIHGEAIIREYKSTLASLNDYKVVDFVNSTTVVIVCSTTGNGDPPNNAEE
jgi:sulfite reductase alpha subunit-like flavoprotein